MAFAIFGLMILAGLCAAIGALMILAAAFGESVVLGLVCIFVPGGLLYFVITRWDEAKRGFSFWAGGLSGVFLVGALGMPRIKEENDAAKEAASAASASAPKKDIKCPAALPPSEGFSLWCCAAGGWEMQAESGCTTTYKPSDTCDSSHLGSTQLAGCSTVGKKKPKTF